MLNTTLRPATPLDLDMITQGERGYMHEIEPGSVTSWEQALERNKDLWIANLERTVVLEIADQPTGYAMWMTEAGVATLITINVLATHRRCGYGRLLLDWFIDDARSNGFGTLKLGVHRDNGAKHLYDRTGFALVGTDGDYLLYSLPRID